MRVLLFILIVLISLPANSQQQDSAFVMTKQDYLRKSRSQLRAGFILLGIGVTTIAILSAGDTDFEQLGVFAVLGGAATIVSIPLFIASARNKRKARAATVSLSIERSTITRLYKQNEVVFPAVTIKLPF